MSQAAIRLERNTFGQLVLIDADGAAHPVTPVRSFPIAAPTEGIGLVGSEGDELAWVERIEGLSPDRSRLYFSSQRGPSPKMLKEVIDGAEFDTRNAGITYEVTGPFRKAEADPAAPTTTLAKANPSGSGSGSTTDPVDADEGSSTSAPVVIGGIALLAAAGAGATLALRRRRPAAGDKPLDVHPTTMRRRAGPTGRAGPTPDRQPDRTRPSWGSTTGPRIDHGWPGGTPPSPSNRASSTRIRRPWTARNQASSSSVTWSAGAASER